VTLLLLQVGPEAGDVIEQPARLVLSGVDSGPQEQLPGEVPGLRDPGAQPQLVPLRRGDQLDLVGVEAELVEPVQPFGDPAPLVLGAQDLLAGQLLPQGLVAASQLLGDLERVDIVLQQPAGLQVEQLAGYPLGGQLDVVLALPV